MIPEKQSEKMIEKQELPVKKLEKAFRVCYNEESEKESVSNGKQKRTYMI